MKINFKDIKAIEKEIKNNYLKIQYQPTFWCNYKCFYCIQGVNSDKRKLTPKEKVYKTAEKIADKLNYYNGNLLLTIVGGEVTIPYDIKEIAEPFLKLNLKNFKLSIITNLSNSLEYYIDLLNYCNKNKIDLRLNASYHYSDFDIFYNKVKKLNTLKNNLVSIKIILTNLPKINNIDPFEAYDKLNKISKVDLVIGRIPNTKNNFFNINSKKLTDRKIEKNKYSIITNKEKIYIENLHNIKEHLNENMPYISFKGFVCEPDSLTIDAEERISYGSCKMRMYETSLDSLADLKPFPKLCQIDGCPLCSINKLERL